MGKRKRWSANQCVISISYCLNLGHCPNFVRRPHLTLKYLGIKSPSLERSLEFQEKRRIKLSKAEKPPSKKRKMKKDQDYAAGEH